MATNHANVESRTYTGRNMHAAHGRPISLQDLAVELQQQIYRCYFDNDLIIDRHALRELSTEHQGSFMLPALLNVSRAMRDAALLPFFQASDIELLKLCPALHNFQHYIDSQGLNFRICQHIRTATLTYRLLSGDKDLEATSMAAKSCAILQELRFVLRRPHHPLFFGEAPNEWFSNKKLLVAELARLPKLQRITILKLPEGLRPAQKPGRRPAHLTAWDMREAWRLAVIKVEQTICLELDKAGRTDVEVVLAEEEH